MFLVLYQHLILLNSYAIYVAGLGASFMLSVVLDTLYIFG